MIVYISVASVGCIGFLLLRSEVPSGMETVSKYCLSQTNLPGNYTEILSGEFIKSDPATQRKKNGSPATSLFFQWP